MIVNLWLLLVALVLLWFPRRWLRFGRKLFSRSRPRSPERAGREIRDARDLTLNFKKEFSTSRNWVDFFRALVAGLAIWCFCTERIPIGAKSVGAWLFVLQAGVLVVAVLIQTMRFSQGRFALAAPVFFILGLSFGLIGWKGALFASVTVWVLNPVLPGPGMFLMAFAALEAGFGLLLSRAPLGMVIEAVFLAILPVILSATTKRRLVRPNKVQKKARSVT